MINKLISTKEIDVRFSEVDSMGIVWHGNYAKYFEDGREAFGKKFELGYMDIFKAGYFAPLVTLDFKFKKVVNYLEKIKIVTEFVPSDAAKIIFNYTIYNEKDEIVVTGNSVQVFLDKNYQLILYNPDFYKKWKSKYCESLNH